MSAYNNKQKIPRISGDSLFNVYDYMAVPNIYEIKTV